MTDSPSGWKDDPQAKSPVQAMRDMLAEDKRYKLDAYQFIREALQYAHEHLAAEVDPATGEKPTQRHITGQQLCEACRRYGVEQFGYLAKVVLANWGVHLTSDFGELVYNLIRIEQMRKSDTDRREDFDNVYDFDEAFEPKFEFVAKNDD